MYELLGCKPSSPALALYWMQLDYAAGNIDSTLCGPNCPCALTNITGFENDLDISATYSKYNIKMQSFDGKLAYQNCSSWLHKAVRNATYSKFYFPPAFGNFSNTINLWNVFEESFNCAGWCRMTYINPDFNATTNTCMNPDRINPCNCTDYDGKACTSCVDKSDNRSACTNYTRPTNNIEKYLLTDVNK